MTTPNKFRKKPVVVEAVQFMPTNPTEFKEVADWCGGERCGFGQSWLRAYLEIPTLEGVMRADYGDYIIKGVAGEFYPCKPKIFEATYEGETESSGEGIEESREAYLIRMGWGYDSSRYRMCWYHPNRTGFFELLSAVEQQGIDDMVPTEPTL